MKQIRQTATKSKLRKAFFLLLAQKPYKDLTISQLSKKANINRGTFYLNYLDKDDLWQQIKQSYENEIRKMFKNQTYDRFDPNDIRSILEYALEHKQELLLLFNSDLAGQMRQVVIDILNDVFSTHISGMKSFMNNKYGRTIIFGTIANIIILWITDGFQESIDQIMKIIFQFRDTAPIDYFY